MEFKGSAKKEQAYNTELVRSCTGYLRLKIYLLLWNETNV
jgi:hypothetical protein